MAAGVVAEGGAGGGRGRHDGAGRDRDGAASASPPGGAQGHHRDRVWQRRAGKPARRGSAGGASPGHRAAAMIGLAPGTRVWLAAGVTDMRKWLRQPGGAGADGAREGPVLGSCVLLSRSPRRSVEAVVVGWRWAVPVCKRLERGRFIWPRAEHGVAVLTPAQLSMLLEGIDWRRPVRTAQPELAG